MPTKRIYNPLLEDFTVTWAGDENTPTPYTIHSREIEEFEVPIANHIAKHLAEQIWQTRGRVSNHDDDIIEIRKEIEDLEL